MERSSKMKLSVVAIAAVTCVMSVPALVSAEERALPVCPPHQFTDRFIGTFTYEYSHAHGVDGADCNVTVTYEEYESECTVCGWSYIWSVDISEDHSVE